MNSAGQNLVQPQLVDKANVLYAQTGRYETKDSQLPAQVFKKNDETPDSFFRFLYHAQWLSHPFILRCMNIHTQGDILYFRLYQPDFCYHRYSRRI